MRFPGYFLTIPTILLTMSALAAAHTQQLPRRGPAERQLDSINRSLNQQQQLRGQTQQNQFDQNQMRMEIQRNNQLLNAPSYGAPGTGLRYCPPGSLGC